MSKEKQACESSTALDSDIPNLEPDTMIYDKTEKDSAIDTSDPHNLDDDFGSFDDDDFGGFDSDDSFGGFDELPQPQHIFNSSEEALAIWDKLLNEIYDYNLHDSFTGNAPKSIRFYVLEEAPESLHSRLTWDSVTKHMDNDTGIPKVRWHQSEIEKLHLMALSCKRSALPPAPARLDMISHRPEPIDTSVSNVPILQSSPITEHTIVTTPSSEKRSSVFGLSSLSRYLPHLSKSNLPRSPTSPSSPTTSSHSFQSTEWTSPITPSSPLTPSNSKSKSISNTYHDDLYSLQGAYNDMNITSVPVTATPSTNVKRSNTVAFSSRFKDSSIITASSSPPRSTSFATMKPRPTSYHQSTDLFDLDTDVQSPTTPLGFKANFKPLIPTISSTPLSPTVCTSPKDMSHVSRASSGDIGSFAAKQDANDVFGDFFNDSGMKALQVATLGEDPFGLDSVMKMSASHSSVKTSNAGFRGMSPAAFMSPAVLSPTILSPQIMSRSPPQQAKNQTVSTMFDMVAVNDQPKSVSVAEEDDDWGDWAF